MLVPMRIVAGVLHVGVISRLVSSRIIPCLVHVRVVGDVVDIVSPVWLVSEFLSSSSWMSRCMSSCVA